MKIPFDIELYRRHPEMKVETGKGENVRILTTNMKSDFPILAIIEDAPNHEDYDSYTIEGKNELSIHDPYNDLFIITPEPELTDWETFISGCLQKYGLLDCGAADRIAKECSTELLSLAREQFIKDGYVIEKKAFHDAVEKIDDKNKAEMSIQYSLHCKVENGTRHAVMNWESFQKVAQKFINIGKAEALKDLPRWKKCGEYTLRTYGEEHFEYRGDGHYLVAKGMEILLSDLENLPKED